MVEESLEFVANTVSLTIRYINLLPIVCSGTPIPDISAEFIPGLYEMMEGYVGGSSHLKMFIDMGLHESSNACTKFWLSLCKSFGIPKEQSYTKHDMQSSKVTLYVQGWAVPMCPHVHVIQALIKVDSH